MTKCKECKNTATYNYKNLEPLYCVEHKKAKMLTNYKRCLEENCEKMSSYNYKGETTRIYCSEHKKDNMIHIGGRLCKNDNCNKHAHFNLISEKFGIYCLEHKKEDMINVKDKKCKEENCNKQPHHNLPNKKAGLYCGEHKKENMIDVKSKKCLEKNCNKQATYGSTKPLYCAQHKKEDMNNVKRKKKCLEENCNVYPAYNFPSEIQGIYCAQHRKNNMVDVKNKKCLQENCDIRPSYNFSGIVTPIYCNKHKKDDMINVKDDKHRCKNNCGAIPNKTNKCKGYCVRCFINLFPNEKVARNYKIKEKHMTDFIKDNFNEEVIIFDKTVGGCSLRRPDCYIDKFTHIVIIECDENQHKDNSCENKRMMELFQDFGNRPIVFIRFNPDKYINEKGEKISSSFKLCKITGISIIKNKKEWNNRLNILKNTISKCLIEIPLREVTNEYLFYNSTQFKSIT